MMDIRPGDHDPKVVLVQLLLATRPPQAAIAVDGHYGPNTQAAVRAFQQLAGSPLTQTGRVDTATWQRLLAQAHLATVDHTDLDDMARVRNSGGNLRQSTRRGEQFGLVALGNLHRSGMGVASIAMGMSNGVSEMINQVMRACAGRRLGLLRIYGHGSAGLQIVSAGHGVTGGSASQGSALTAQAVRAMAGDWGRLRSVFARYGSVELHGCHVGQGSSGRDLLRELANLWGVPVSAGSAMQHVGHGRTARFEGAVHTMFPGGGTLRSWSAQVAASDGMCSRAS